MFALPAILQSLPFAQFKHDGKTATTRANCFLFAMTHAVKPALVSIFEFAPRRSNKSAEFS